MDNFKRIIKYGVHDQVWNQVYSTISVLINNKAKCETLDVIDDLIAEMVEHSIRDQVINQIKINCGWILYE